MSIDWKAIETAPKDRAIYLWSDREGAVKLRWEKTFHREGWSQVPINDDPNVCIGGCSMYPPEYTHWCETSELEPVGAKKVRNYHVKKLVS